VRAVPSANRRRRRMARQRGRVVLRRIEDRRRRGICFRKRRAGLVKKAEELAVLCDADVALLVVSPFDGTVHRFAAPATYVLLTPLIFSGDLFLLIRFRAAPTFRTVVSFPPCESVLLGRRHTLPAAFFFFV
jgi:hypothetical protein